MPKGSAVKLRTLLDNLKALTVLNPPQETNTKLYLCLYMTDPKANDTGTEANYPGYVRKEVTFGDPSINGDLAEIKNTNAIEFAVVPSNTGTNIGWAAIKTGLIGGQLIYYGALAATYPLNQGVKPTVPIGNLTIYEN